jgi:hypothetical protein
MPPRKPPEYRSMLAFLAFLDADGTKDFSFEQLQELHRVTKESRRLLREEMEALGYRYLGRPHEKRVRGVKTSSNDRWFGPGSEKTYGGSGFDNRE